MNFSASATVGAGPDGAPAAEAFAAAALWPFAVGPIAMNAVRQTVIAPQRSTITFVEPRCRIGFIRITSLRRFSLQEMNEDFVGNGQALRRETQARPIPLHQALRNEFV